MSNNIDNVKIDLDAKDYALNEVTGYINYGYDTPANLVPDTSVTSSARVGVVRSGTTVILNYDGGASKEVTVKISGDVSRCLSSNADTQWTTDGLELISGHQYKVTLKMVSGTCTGTDNPTPSISVYKIGTNSTVGSYNKTEDTYIRTFIADGSLYNIIIYISKSMVLIDAKFIVTFEDTSALNGVQWKSNAEISERYFDMKINAYHGLLDYGYGDAVEEYQANTSTENSGAWVGVKRYKTLVTLNMAQSETAKRVRLTGPISRVSGNNTYKQWDGQLQLVEGKEYIIHLKHISGLSVLGENSKLPGIVVYASKGSSSIATALKSNDVEKTAKFVAPAETINIALYFDIGMVFENAVFDITLSEYDEGSNIETYYLEEMADTVAKVREENNEPALVFPLVTDIHRYTASVQTFSKMIANISYLSKRIKCDFVANLGDTIEGNTAQSTSLRYAHDCIDDFMNIGLPLLYSQGNHDNNPYISSGAQKFNIKQCFSAFYTATKNAVFNMAENGTDYYVDFPSVGVRVISLNACNVSVSSTYAFGSSTAQWLENTALDTQYTVILIEHLSSIPSQVWNNNAPTNRVAVTDKLTAFVSNGGTIIQLNGHSHVDMAFISPWLSIAQVCQKFAEANISSADYQDITGYIDALDNPARTENTHTEDAWSVCLYKPLSNEFDMIRFGAGSDRYFHVTPIEPTTVISRLTDVTWSTSDATVATVSDGVITGAGTGRCGILAKDADGNYECWIVEVN